MGLAGVKYLRLRKAMDVRGENSHLRAELLAALKSDGTPLRENIYDAEHDIGVKKPTPSWTNIGDTSAVLRTSVNLGEIYQGTDEPFIAVNSKHTRPVALAKGKTQLEATVKAIAGDLNSPFGGVWGFNTGVEKDTAEFLNRMFLVGVVAPEYQERAADELRKDKSRILIRTGEVSSSDIDILKRRLQPVALGYFILQDNEPVYDVYKQAVVVTGADDSNITSLDNHLLRDIEFAGNAALYLSSNLVFFVHDGAIAGLGDGCGARTVAARKARNMLEDSAYAAISDTLDPDDKWVTILNETPFSREDFSGLKKPVRLTAFSDAFYPKLDGFVETAGLDRINDDFQNRQVQYQEKGATVTFIPKRRNFDPGYNKSLIPEVVVQPGGSKIGDRVINPIARSYDVQMVFTMTPGQLEDYLAGKPRITGRRFFGHVIM